MKKILVLGASSLQIPIIKKALELGHYVIAVDKDRNAPGFNFAHEKNITSTTDINSVLQIADYWQVDGILTAASDMPMRTVAAVGEKFDLKTISRQSALWSTDKFLMRQKLEEYNVPIPQYFLASDSADYNEALNSIEGEKIVKPVDSSGSRGVYLLNNLNDKKKAYSHAMKYSKSKKIIIEEYMVGWEVSVESFTENGETTIVAITDKITSGAPHFYELGHSIQSKVTDSTREQLKSITKKAVEALNIQDGPAHTELILTESGPKVIEIGARLGGDNITSHLVPLATGIDLLSLHIKQSLNESIEINSSLNNGAAIKYIESKNGKLKDIRVPQFLKDDKEIIEIKFNYELGESVNETQDSSNRLGHIIVKSGSAKAALEKCEYVKKNIFISYES